MWPLIPEAPAGEKHFAAFPVIAGGRTTSSLCNKHISLVVFPPLHTANMAQQKYFQAQTCTEVLNALCCYTQPP